MPETQYKICPRCQTHAALTAPSCVNCGRKYSTQFAPPTAAHALPTARPKWIVPTVICVIAFIPVLGGALAYDIKQKSLHRFSAAPSVPAKYAGELSVMPGIWEGTSEVPLAVSDKSVLKLYYDAGGAVVYGGQSSGNADGSNETRDELRVSGKIFVVPSGTKCKVLDVDTAAGIADVEILDGVHAGDEGLLYTHALGRFVDNGRFVQADGNSGAFP